MCRGAARRQLRAPKGTKTYIKTMKINNKLPEHSSGNVSENLPGNLPEHLSDNLPGNLPGNLPDH